MNHVATETIVKALRITAKENMLYVLDKYRTLLFQAADRLEELEAANDNYRLHRECVEIIRDFEVRQMGVRYGSKEYEKYTRTLDSAYVLRGCVWNEIQEWEGQQ